MTKQVAVNESNSLLIGKLVNFYEYDKRGELTKMYGEVMSSFVGEDRKDHGREILHIKLIDESVLKYGYSYTDQYYELCKEI